MRVAHNCERAEFARLRREDSKKMKQMRDEILRLKIALSDATTRASEEKTTMTREGSMEKHKMLAPAGAAMMMMSSSSSPPPPNSYLRLKQESGGIASAATRSRRGGEEEFADTKEYFQSFSSEEEEEEEEEYSSSSWSASDEGGFVSISNKSKRSVGLKKRDENKEKRPLVPPGKKDETVKTSTKTKATAITATAQPENDDENDRDPLLVRGHKAKVGGKPPLPPTFKKQQRQKKKNTHKKDEAADEEREQKKTLAARMGFTATIGNAISAVTEQRRSSRDVAKVTSYKEPSLLTKMRRP